MSADSSRPSPRGQSPSYRVAEAVADARDSEPTALEPLNRVVDPDALDALFTDEADDGPCFPGCVSFTFAGCDVVVDSDGNVEVSPRE